MDMTCIAGSFSRNVLTHILPFGAILMAAIPASAFAANCSGPLEAGRHRLTVEAGGQARSAVYFVPSSYTGRDKVPVVFDLHGSNSGPNEQLKRSGWDRVAEKNGFIVVAPQGSLTGTVAGTSTWNVPFVTTRTDGLDEIAYLRNAVKTVARTFCVDTARVYASGYSGGGRMLSAYLCAGNDDFAAAGFVHSLRAGRPVEIDGKWQPDVANCNPARPVSIIAFAGVKDTANPYAGGGRPYWQYSFKAAVQRWSELDGCKGAGDPKTVAGVTYNIVATCRNDTRIVSYVFANGGHDWPKPNAAAVASNESEANAVKVSKAAGGEPAFDTNIDPASRMWDFFIGNGGGAAVSTAAAGAPKASSADCAQGVVPAGVACNGVVRPANAKGGGAVEQAL